MVNCRIVIWLMTSHCFSGSLFVDQGAILGWCGRGIGRADFHRTVDARREKKSIDRVSNSHSSELSDTASSDERHVESRSGTLVSMNVWRKFDLGR